MSAQFNIKAADPAAVARIERGLGLPRFVAATLVARGIVEPEQVRTFLEPSLDRDWLDPYGIPGLSEVADALEAVMRKDGRIVVFGDFDLDGISATSVLTRGLRALGAHADPFIPRRFEEGYGLTEAAFERARTLDPDFIVTVDCGIACKVEAAAIVAAGVGLAVTDHHEPVDLVPEGVPVADPKCDEACESAILAGVGVALKLVQVLGGRFGYPHLWRSYTDLATLGTVADLMPMRGENRALVADGIRRMNDAPRPCIAALLGTSGAADKPVSATNLSFSLIPRLNAAGRMGDAQLALDLLMTDDFDTACRLAQELEAVNDQRRTIEAELSEIAKAQAADLYHGQRALVVSGDGWHEGVKGIVASRLVNAYGVPSLLFTIDGDEARGSGRSVGQVNLFKAVESASDLLTRFGGHDAAVGVTLPADKLPEFSERLCAYMDELPEGAFHPLIEIDTCVALDELTLENVEKLDALAPFGQENPVPCFLARDVTLVNCRAVGAEKNHFSCSLSDGRNTVAGIMFHCTDIEALMHTDSVVNAAFEVQIDEWRGRRTVKAMLQSLAPARTCGALEACLNPENLSFVADLYATSDAELCADVEHSPEAVEAYEAARAANREQWERKAASDPAGLEADIVRAIIGDGALHASQRTVLDHLDAGRSVLAVMATGRGKSLVFQVHAACRALRERTASLFVYPLRALIADQAFHLNEALEPFGIAVSVLTGESTPEERRQTFAGLADGSVDIVLTTPEFLGYHAGEFAQSRRIGFVVVDEAHHIGLARAGQRPAYAAIGQAVAQLGEPVVLALTATADDGIADAIRTALPLDELVLDEADRPNLGVDDRRNLKNREDYLANLVASGEKTVVYVNSREQSVAVARTLRKRVPQMAPLIGFYNAGLTRVERARVEDLFRTDALKVLVATSAFGEGVNIPNIKHVVLYHLPYNEVEFNQMSGRAGRDGTPAQVHLLFGRNDAGINEQVLRDMTPDHDCLAQVYRRLRAIQRDHGDAFFTLGNVDLAKLASEGGHAVSPASAACGVAVFRELGLIETHTAYASGETTRSIRVVDTNSKVELTDSVRYREGLGERAIFNAFRDWAMGADAASLRVRVSRPILPGSASRADR
ncbi:single-stranded-DNA-specific exonuclease RecJ [Gordonibacter massiliensis (ex Traore et al. 2017)]|uniref:Single-stranded-DNA-specific exonuclease RecJ n=1 Tax=Gordonibacter massiliensis (ex Traore et al. 2017) TaxID=1841863 RepID=A0A842JG99_9ACTN|nr:single-stranded-DNA-specific exonuclease RecJ [Gordonibacter massiliensis (ex Traore et al. 2017)]MBC2888329.1 single-stranded-DNA-specific exonuclease RecJ [Gordonibacter massiliensis (ex Traore et al. 2017)]MBX9032959.1 single-stranded-DNA-specific exonuclease RecJ [Gordonibacter massiliensis (ex Traore et al. 2017)]